jgi:hypothetical protein
MVEEVTRELKQEGWSVRLVKGGSPTEVIVPPATVAGLEEEIRRVSQRGSPQKNRHPTLRKCPVNEENSQNIAHENVIHPIRIDVLAGDPRCSRRPYDSRRGKNSVGHSVKGLSPKKDHSSLPRRSNSVYDHISHAIAIDIAAG